MTMFDLPFLTENVTVILELLAIAGVLLGIRWMSSPVTAPRGNGLSAACMGIFILLALHRHKLLQSGLIWGALAIGAVIGLILGQRVRMIRMPELVALLNGFGGGASAIVAWLELTGQSGATTSFVRATGGLGIAIGMATLSGSLLASAKLSRWLSQRPVNWRGLNFFKNLLLLLALACLVVIAALPGTAGQTRLVASLLGLAAFVAGWLAVMRIGGADMPIAISLLNSLSGVAASFAGFALNNFVLVAVGGIVGASGLVLTRIMCRAMNRNLGAILSGRTTQAPTAPTADSGPEPEPEDAGPAAESVRPGLTEAVAAFRQAGKVILVPGYGMAVAQAQQQVKQLYDKLCSLGHEVAFAIHPVAGRMPGHMHVLLAEVQIPYEKFMELEQANPQFPETDVVVAIGANDVINPAANTAVDTPIYGMPVLDVNAAKQIVICNLDAAPGYAGVPNPLYEHPDTMLLFGDAAETVAKIVSGLTAA